MLCFSHFFKNNSLINLTLIMEAIPPQVAPPSELSSKKISIVINPTKPQLPLADEWGKESDSQTNMKSLANMFKQKGIPTDIVSCALDGKERFVVVPNRK